MTSGCFRFGIGGAFVIPGQTAVAISLAEDNSGSHPTACERDFPCARSASPCSTKNCRSRSPPASASARSTCSPASPTGTASRSSVTATPTATRPPRPRTRSASSASRRSSSIAPCRRSPGPGFYARLAGNLLSPLPYSVATHASPALADAVRDARRRQPRGPVALRVDALRPGAARRARRRARGRPVGGDGPQRRVAHLAALHRDRGEPGEAVVRPPAVAEVRAVRAVGLRRRDARRRRQPRRRRA